ncbi:aspartate kinase [Bacteroidales bacterium WCE2008]|nr:aspartate kinase [Bacteroidales bacterium WCE2008]
MKFGGTSVKDEAAISRVIGIVRGRLAEKPLVVVSAMSKVTRNLCSLGEAAAAGNEAEVSMILKELRERHFGTAAELMQGGLLEETKSRLAEILESLSEMAAKVAGAGKLDDDMNSAIISCGELMSSIIVGAAMNAAGLRCTWLDARKMMTTDSAWLAARPDMDATEAKVRKAVDGSAEVFLTQGFIAADTAGRTTVLGFEGSDYSAAIFGRCLDAARVEIWTDVDGIRSADPRIVEDTCRIERLSYAEAAEMAYMGARVLHPLTIYPAREKNIPIHVLNSARPDGAGSVVCGDCADIPEGPKSVALMTAADLKEVVSMAASDMDGKSRISVIGKGVAAVLDKIGKVAGEAVVSENGLSASVMVPEADARRIVVELHKLLFV